MITEENTNLVFLSWPFITSHLQAFHLATCPLISQKNHSLTLGMILTINKKIETTISQKWKEAIDEQLMDSIWILLINKESLPWCHNELLDYIQFLKKPSKRRNNNQECSIFTSRPWKKKICSRVHQVVQKSRIDYAKEVTEVKLPCGEGESLRKGKPRVSRQVNNF